MTLELSAAARELLQVQRAVIACWQAPAVGLDVSMIKSQVRSGRWQPLQLGVYATFTGRPGREAQLWAAVLRAGPAAVLSHQSAAELDGLTGPPSPLIHITVPNGQHVSKIAGVRVHRSRRITLARHPVRLPPRTRIEETVLDLTQTAPTLEAASGWLCQGCASRLTTPQLLGAAIAARARVRWREDLCSILVEIHGGAHSVLELRYIRDVERPHGLPQPRRQARQESDGHLIYRDNFLADYLICVELDGQSAHPADQRWQDIQRDNAAAAAGIITLRYSWADITDRPCQTASQIIAILRQRGWTGQPCPCQPGCPVVTTQPPDH